MDLKFALRSLRRTPGFTILSVLILALGIGANTAIFSVVNGVVLRPLGYRDPSRLVAVTHVWRNKGNYGNMSGPDFLDYQSQSTAFESMAAYGDESTSVVAGGKPEFAGIAGVSPDFLRCLGVSPVAGRGLSPSDYKAGRPTVALVGAGFWQRHFGDVPFRAGQTLKAEGLSLQIIGILPAPFHFPEMSATEIWTTYFEPPEQTSRSSGNFRSIGRLKPGVTLEQAQAQLNTISARLARQYPDSNKDVRGYVSTLTNYTVRHVKTSLYILLAAVGLVLLIAFANVANLLLARGFGRVREFAIRTAVGATHARIIRQLLVETLILGSAGCLGGVLVAYACLPALLSLAPQYVPRLNEVQIDGTTLTFCVVSALALTVLFGLSPAFQVSKVDTQRNLRSAGVRGVLGGAPGRFRQTFVTAEIALCLVLLVSAGFLMRSFAAMTSVDLGYRPQKLLLAEISVPAGYGQLAQQANLKLFNPLLAELKARREIQSLALTAAAPASPDGRPDGSYIITGQSLKDWTSDSPYAGFSIVSPGFFQTLGIRLIAGRSFNERDDPNAPLVAIISQKLAQTSFPKQNPVGQKILCGADLISMKWMTIVGVVADAHLDKPTDPPRPEIYMPYAQHPRPELTLLVRAGADPMRLAQPLSATIRSLNSEASIKFTTLEQNLGSAVATPRFSSTLTSLFAGLAVLLAAIGIYGVMAYSVGQRTAEIGLRMAVGANRGTILQMILAETLKLTGVGLAVGLLGSWMAARLLKSQLFEVSTSNPVFYVLMVVVLIAVALLAGCVPATRASLVEPLEALRQE